MRTTLIEDMQRGIDRIKSMEDSKAPKEHIELVAQELRRKFNNALLMPPMHPTILEFAELVDKYLVQ